MKTLLTLIPLITSITACVGPRYTVDGDVNVGTTAAIKVVPHFQLFRSKEVITRPNYKDCLVDSEHAITENVVEAYQTSIVEALANAGVTVVDANDESATSEISVDLHILGNGDYGSLRFYTGVGAKDADGAELNPKGAAKHGTFKAMRYMPSRIGKVARNDYCTDLWAQDGEAISGDLGHFMNELAEHHVNELARKGALPNS